MVDGVGHKEALLHSKNNLPLRGINTEKHEGVERMFGPDYIKTRKFELKMGKAIGMATS